MNKKQAYIFFESNAVLMSTQIRNLITSSLLEYRAFFERFNKKQFKTSEQIIEDQKDVNKPIEDAVLVVSMKDTDKAIVFSESLDTIKSELLKVIENFISVSHSFPRAELNIARSDKTQLWPVTLEDELVQSRFKEIEAIIQNNLNAVANVVNIFEKYNFLLVSFYHYNDMINL